MGDRGNVYVAESWTPRVGVYLYTHWGGTELPDVVQKVLARKLRWDDPAYLARMIFCAMIGDDHENFEGETGYGISQHVCDNEYPIIVVDCESQRIGFAPEPKERNDPQPKPVRWWTFAEFTAMPMSAVNKARESIRT